jgi:IPT/TIG domain
MSTQSKFSGFSGLVPQTARRSWRDWLAKNLRRTASMISQKKQSLTILLSLVAALAMGASGVAQQAAFLTRPVLTSLHPSAASAKSGAASQLVVAAGQNFVHGVTTVQVQGTARSTTVINSEALAFELTATDLAQPQTLMVSVVNQRGTQPLKSNSLPFVVLP